MDVKLLAACWAIALVVAFLLTPLMRRLALALHIVDEPDARKIHAYPVPYLGGVAMYVAVMIGLAIGSYLFPSALQEQVLAIAAGLSIIALLGIVDDIAGLSAWAKLPFEIGASLLIAFSGIRIDVLVFGVPQELAWLTWPVTVIWIVALTNAINLLDGLDGLAAGVVCIAAAANLATAIAVGIASAGLIYVVLIGACLGFLCFNFHPAKIFMGDTGSLQLGFLLAITGILGSESIMVFSLLPVGLPLFDVLLAIVRRSRAGRNVFAADRDHLHHRLLRIGLSHRAVVCVYYVLSVYLGIAAIVIARLDRLYVLLMFALYIMGIFLGWSVLQFIEKSVLQRLQVAEGREPAGEATIGEATIGEATIGEATPSV